MLVWFQITTTYLGPKWGYITGLAGYWSYCLFTAWLMAGFDWNYFRKAWGKQSKHKYANWITFVAFIPVIPTFFFQFLPIASRLTLATGALLIFTSVVNGPIEEFYWRGLYLLEYRHNKWIGFGLSTLFFGAWHFSVWFAKGVSYSYSGGIIPLIGGAFLLGAIWSFVTRSNGNFRAAAFAHVLINLFALAGLFVKNGF